MKDPDKADHVLAPARSHRILFWTGAFFAGWVALFSYLEGLLGYNSGLPFKAPPLHVRTIASLYTGGAVMMLLAARARTMAAIRIPMVVAGLFTGLLLVVSFLHLHVFDFAPPPPKPPLLGISWLPLPFQVSWFWFALYGICPFIVLHLLRRYWVVSAPVNENPLPWPMRILVATTAFVGGSFALFMLCQPTTAVQVWPWGATPFLLHIYAGPFLAFALASWMMAMTRDRVNATIPAAGLMTFALLALAASLSYLHVLQPLHVAAWIWLIFLIVLVMLSAATLFQAQKSNKG